MDLPSAIDEFVTMLSLGADALERLAKRDAKSNEIVASVAASLAGIRWSADRLKSLAGDLRKPASDGQAVQIQVEDSSGMRADRPAKRPPQDTLMDACIPQAIEDDMVSWRSSPTHGCADERGWTTEEAAARLKQIIKGDDR